MRNAMTLRGVLTAQENFKAHGAAHWASPMGFSISLHSSERRSLIYWRMPGLSINSRRGFTRHLYPSKGLSLIYWRVSCAAAAARCAASLVPFTAPLHLRPMSVTADAGVLSPSAPARGILALLSASLFRIRPVMVIFPLRKQIIRRPCNFFAIADSLLSVQSTN